MRRPLGLIILVSAACQGPSQSGGPLMLVEGGAVRLPEIAEGERALAHLQLQNIGNEALTLLDAELDASPAWREVAWPALPLILAPRARLALPLEYSPSYGAADGGIWLQSDEVDRPRLRVPIGALEPMPSVLSDVTEVHFSEVPTGESMHRTVRLANGGSGVLEIHRVDLADETSSDFSLTREEVSALAPGEWIEAVVSYQPTGGDVDYGTLRVETNDVRTPQMAVQLRGEQSLAPVY